MAATASELASTAECNSSLPTNSASEIADNNINQSAFEQKEPRQPKLAEATRPTSSRECLAADAQQLIEDINAKRKQDSDIMADYKKALEVHVQIACSKVEKNLFDLYQRQGAMIQQKLEELFATLDRIAKLEKELHEFKHLLGSLYQDMSQEA